MAVAGQWTLHFSFGCTGRYSQVLINLNNDGTFNIPSENTTGKWVQVDGMILWQYNNVKTTYGETLQEM